MKPNKFGSSTCDRALTEWQKYSRLKCSLLHFQVLSLFSFVSVFDMLDGMPVYIERQGEIQNTAGDGPRSGKN